jgi:hypothetical protein
MTKKTRVGCDRRVFFFPNGTFRETTPSFERALSLHVPRADAHPLRDVQNTTKLGLCACVLDFRTTERYSLYHVPF